MMRLTPASRLWRLQGATRRLQGAIGSMPKVMEAMNVRESHPTEM